METDQQKKKLFLPLHIKLLIVILFFLVFLTFVFGVSSYISKKNSLTANLKKKEGLLTSLIIVKFQSMSKEKFLEYSKKGDFDNILNFIEISNILIIDSDDKIVYDSYPTNISLKLMNIITRDDNKKRLEDNGYYDSFFSNIFTDKKTYDYQIYMQKDNEYNGILYASVDLRDFRTAITKLLTSTVLVFLVVFIVSTIIFLYATKLIIKPIRLLKNCAEKVADGNFDSKITFTSNDELGLLADSFNKMMEKLKEYNDMHLDQIKKLNEELTLKNVEQEASYEELETTNEELITTNEELEIANRDLFNMAQELKKSKEELEKNMAIVKSANEKLWVLNKIKTNFLGMASHELKTPLVMIKGYAELVLDNQDVELDKTTEEMVTHILKGANILNSIIRDMLDITKIEAKDLKLNLISIDLRLLITTAIDEMIPIAKERNQTISLGKIPKTKILTDSTQIHRVLVHLISNAIKFTPDGGKIEVYSSLVKDEILASMYEEAGFVDAVDIVVSDSGIGIDKKDLERIFDVFYEVGDINHHRTSKSAYMGKGSGLGLSICKGIVEAHKGRIWGESEGTDLNNFPGSKFHIVLPLAQKELEELKKEAIITEEEELLIPEEMPVEEKKPKILLIEDEKDIVELTSVILRERYSLIVANNGVDGIKEAFSSKPDLILLDIYMKGLNGFEVCSILKGNESTKDIPIAMFTAGTQKYEIEKGYSMGIDDYITKPFKPKELLLRIQKLLKPNPADKKV